MFEHTSPGLLSSPYQRLDKLSFFLSFFLSFLPSFLLSFLLACFLSLSLSLSLSVSLSVSLSLSLSVHLTLLFSFSFFVNSFFPFQLTMAMITCSVGSLSERTAQTYPLCQSAWTLAHSLIDKLLAPCRNKLSRCTCTTS